ncbi:LacI family DNA-binding transcriptional regulator [Frondihabitans sp. VKM Ac-2883]|uniref:LacI family DNA-binding transcriptional regulator n=1 Tax=Frondihabitans sp. VKM Ac-2883 TaxID=2783823 RepID=UPI00188D0BF2|nr:LacI family DNA-binding transcriptional regulator [Frondihabitans sp. VKM Ac-2883]MBF4577159.1 LacI family DNA-binding transcriptional regulator [Frondihabitans sp. VKM Ac-2883]
MAEQQRGDTGSLPKSTLADVARLAGVSIATASKALNKKTHVREETRQRVEEAASSLDFTPNFFAKALNSTRTNTIGMITSDLDNRFVLPILLGAEDAFGSGSLSVLLADARDDVLREQLLVQTLLTRRVDGLLIVGRTTNSRPPATVPGDVPVVYVYAPSDDDADTSFTPDNVMAGRLAAERLLKAGRTRIALVNGEASYAAARDRAEGVAQAMQEARIPLVGGKALFGQWGEGWGRDCARLLASAHSDLDGIVAGSDHIARGVIDALREEGRRVPDDVSVVGFDNWDILVRESRPPLTSVDMNLDDLGRSAAQALVDAIDGRPRTGRHVEPVRLVVRES